MEPCFAMNIASGGTLGEFGSPDSIGALSAAQWEVPEGAAEPSAQTSTWRASQIPFEDIVGRYTSMVYSIALHFLRDGGLAEDIAQEAFLRLIGNLGGIKSETHLALWLRRVTVRLCIDEHRKFAKRFVPLESVQEPALEPSDDDFLADERIRAMVGQLPPESRMALILKFQEGLSPSEIAEVMKKPINTVKSRLHRALATLREKLAPIFNFENERGEARYDQDL